jgi:hypothetical protein
MLLAGVNAVHLHSRRKCVKQQPLNLQAGAGRSAASRGRFSGHGSRGSAAVNAAPARN